MLDWDDLRIFLAAARGRSFATAGLKLGMDATTVGRRVQRLEAALGATLFGRSPQGLHLTSAGARLLESSLDVETAVESMQTVHTGVFGTVRMSASEGFGAHVLAPALPDLLQRRPDLTVELVANSGVLSPSIREVDVAVTLNPPVSERLSVERLTDYELGLYAAAAYLDRAGRPTTRADLFDHPLIGYIDDLIYAPELRYLAEVEPGLRPRASSSSIRAQLAMIAAGAGVGILPRFMAEPGSGLERVLADEVRLKRTFWVAVHQDLRATPRVRAVLEWMSETASRNRDRLLG